MFDLIEEDLSTQKSEQKKETQEGEVDLEGVSVYVMPEHIAPSRLKGGGGKGLVYLLVGVVVLALLGFGVFIALRLVNQKQTQTSQNIQQQTPEEGTEAESDDQILDEPIVEEMEQATSTEGIAASEADHTSTSTPPVPTPVQEQQQLEERPQIIEGEDADKDGLTDVEERMYKTDPQKPDSDSDGFLDGAEIKKLFDPTRLDGKLEVSDLASGFTSTKFNYSFLYPKSDTWTARAVTNEEKEVIVSNPSGEFFSIKAEENLKKLSVIDWFTTVFAPGQQTTQMESYSTDFWSGIMSPDGRTVYAAKKSVTPQDGSPTIFVIQYNLNTKHELQYSATFQMLLQSFTFSELSFTR